MAGSSWAEPWGWSAGSRTASAWSDSSGTQESKDVPPVTSPPGPCTPAPSQRRGPWTCCKLSRSAGCWGVHRVQPLLSPGVAAGTPPWTPATGDPSSPRTPGHVHHRPHQPCCHGDGTGRVTQPPLPRPSRGTLPGSGAAGPGPALMWPCVYSASSSRQCLLGAPGRRCSCGHPDRGGRAGRHLRILAPRQGLWAGGRTPLTGPKAQSSRVALRLWDLSPLPEVLGALLG